VVEKGHEKNRRGNNIYKGVAPKRERFQGKQILFKMQTAPVGRLGVVFAKVIEKKKGIRGHEVGKGDEECKAQGVVRGVRGEGGQERGKTLKLSQKKSPAFGKG